MLKTVLIMLAILVVIAAAGVTWAKRSGHCSMENRMHHVTERIGRKLDLDGDQQARLVNLGETLRSLRAERHDDRIVAQEQLTGLLAAPSLDRDRAVALIDQRFQTMNDQVRSVVDAFAEFSDSLAPTQRAQLAQFIDDRMNHRWGPSRWTH